MRPAPAAVAPFLASNRFFHLVDLISFRLTHGELLQYSAGASPFSLPGSIFPPQSINASGGYFALGPKFGRTRVTTKVGVQVDTMELQIMAGYADPLGALTWQQAFAYGVFDGARVEVDRLVLAPRAGSGYGPAQGAIVWFQGIVGEANIGRSLISVTCNSMLALLRIQMPRRLWQGNCTHVFGDAMCQFDRTTMNFTGACSVPPSTQWDITMAVNPNPANLYDGGTIVGVSGQNAGYVRTISVVESSIAKLTTPFIFPVINGDVFELLPGCDHQVTTCQNTFNNLVHFGGFPYIPPAEFSI